MLLRKIGAIRKRDRNEPGFDATEFGADESHYRLFCEALFDFFREGKVLLGHGKV